jgi:tetratricopeptide (TPR) repeat protein
VKELFRPSICTASARGVVPTPATLLRKFLKAILPAVIVLAIAAAAWGKDLSQAEELFNHADYGGSLALLDKHTQDPVALFLIGRDYLMSGELKKASEFLERAAAAAPANSEYQDWLGRAYGKRAETSNFLSAAGWASKARDAFKRAVELDPKNPDALDDLFDYYLDAPGFMGGGIEKAEQVADRITAIDPAQGLYDKAKLDQKAKEYSKAEAHLRQAVAIAPQGIGHMIELAKLLAKEGRIRESDQVFAQAQKAAPNSPLVMFAYADVLIKQKRELDEAKSLLEKYLQSPITPDDPPREAAYRLLKQARGS